MRAVIFAPLGLALSIAWGGPSRAADYAPIDCRQAASASERAVCENYLLGQDEARMATLFQIATSMVGMGQRAQLQDDQRSFLSARNGCSDDVACLQRIYDARIQALQVVLNRIAQRGPF